MTINSELQRIADSILISLSDFYSYSVILVADAKSGRILIASCYKENRFDYNICFNENFPGASLFKIVTAVASIEVLDLKPEDDIYFSGKIYSQDPETWLISYPTKKQSFKTAFGTSNNPIFGKLAMFVGSWNLYNYGKKMFFDVIYPKDDFSIALMGAGFINNYIKPIDALRLMVAISNDGYEKSITLIDSISGFYYYTPKTIKKIMNEKTSYKLRELFKETVISGTASKFLMNSNVGGKTGSITDKIHNGYIKWFVGFFPVDEPKYAFVSMTVEKKYNKKLSPILNIKPIIEILHVFGT
ncbi:MAG: penicillin-binding transpeptidase domain-containing protein [candidate division WOR-3 bacterium]